jgi:hypothetical protein
MARRKHFQHGSLFKRGKKNKVWVARYWEPVIGANGEAQRVRRLRDYWNSGRSPYSS